LLDHVLVDMRRGKIPHALVKGRDGVAVWRAGGACTHGGLAAATSNGSSPTPLIRPSGTFSHSRGRRTVAKALHRTRRSRRSLNRNCNRKTTRKGQRL
jgi:hypothetical protein